MEIKIKNKRALSSIVTTVLIILISLAAISILFVVVKNFVSEPTLSPGFSCFDEQINPKLTIEKACYNSQTGEVEATIKRSSGISMNTLVFTLDNDSFACSDSCGSCGILGEGQTKTYFLEVEEEPRNLEIFTQNCKLNSRIISSC